METYQKAKEIQIDSNILENLFRLSKKDIEYALNKNLKSIYLDFSKILSIIDVSLAEEIIKNPKEYLNKISEYFSIKIGKEIKVRLYNLPESRFLRIRDIRSEHLNQLIEVEGIIKISSEVRPYIKKQILVHTECNARFVYEVKDFRLENPKVCPVCGRPGGKFIEIEREIEDIQNLVIEEPADQIEKGEQPAQIRVILRDDLCEPKMERKTIPGTRVRICGIVKSLQNAKNGALMDLYIDAIYIEPIDKEYEDLTITPEDEEQIKDFAKNADPLNTIAKSIAPNLYGKHYEIIKRAIALQLVSGRRKVLGKGFSERKNIHILIVGDPGVGKSQLLKSVSSIAPKSRYVVGVSSSQVGLTATVRKDELLKGGWVLEAGALVLASGGIVCIDELDKFGKEEMMALHEAMEQQTITIDKANIHATLKTEVSILAAANPEFGRWDKTKTIAEQINLPPTIINRFDLIFVLLDEPNPESDRIVAEEIVKNIDREHSLLISEDFLRKYIAYAKKIEPKWTEKAKEEVINFYLKLREQYAVQNVIPITTRQLQTIIRLAEASAKIRLSEIVTEDDVKFAENLLIYSLKQVGIDPETKRLDVDIILTGHTTSERAKLSSVLDIIKSLSKDFPKGVPLSEIVEYAKKYNLDENKVRDTINKLLKEGYIYETGPNTYLPI